MIKTPVRMMEGEEKFEGGIFKWGPVFAECPLSAVLGIAGEQVFVPSCLCS